MDIIYKHYIPEKEQFYKLFETTGWNKEYKLTMDELFRAIKNSWDMVSAYDNENLIGYGRIISDGVMHALILDMIVLPEYQKNGIGSSILDKLVDRCKQWEIRDIQLFCAKGQAEFYKKHSFSRRPENAPGMEIKLKKQ